MGKLERQHFLPQFYLRGFMDPKNKPFIWMYEKGSELIKPVSVKDAAVHSNYYAFEKEDGTINRYSYEEGFAKIEDIVAPSIKKALNFEPINNIERGHISTFMALSFLRVPSFRDGIKKTIESHHRAQAMHMALDKEIFMKEMKEIEIEHNKDLGDLDALREDFIEGKYNIEVDEYRSLGILNHSLFPLASVIHRHYWHFLVAPYNCKFITCDNPFFYINPYKKLLDQKGVGLETEKTEITFPLSKEIAILAKWKNEKDNYVSVSKNKVDEINRRTVISSNRFVYSSQKSNKLKKLVIKYKDVRPILKEEYCNDNGKLLSAQTREIISE